ncbi:MAG: N-6 DNA methylase [Cytophagales bacterium]|nr:N-6 DNA methylase [Cytophagales bacterium]
MDSKKTASALAKKACSIRDYLNGCEDKEKEKIIEEFRKRIEVHLGGEHPTDQIYPDTCSQIIVCSILWLRTISLYGNLKKTNPFVLGLLDFLLFIKARDHLRVICDEVIDYLKKIDLAELHKKLLKDNKSLLHDFYQHFIKVYDPKIASQLGIVYTPDAVVNFIVRASDDIIKKEFGREKGLSDPSVKLEDPFTGSGAFLMGAVRKVLEGKDQQEQKDIIQNHVLPNFSGNELLMTPTILAHMNLHLLLFYEFGITLEDGESFNIVCKDTFEEPE